TRYLLALPEALPPATTLPASGALTLADKWILTRLRETAGRMSELFNGYDFGNATETIWRFLWYEYCDWYVEATKAQRNQPTRAAVLSFVWNNAMRLLHPIAPFISEEIWLALPHDGPTIVTATWPDPLEIPAFDEAARDFAGLMRTVERVRNLRAETGLHPKERITIEIPANVPEEMAELLALLGAATPERIAPAGDSLDEALAAVRVHAPQEVLEERYRKEAAHLRSEIDRGEKKLGNEAFVAKAAPHIVAKEREKLEGYRAELQRVEGALRALKEPA
ncbi:MAG TPA: class I tRNA ligase family protein, partial [Candidatus Cybelea sp.]